MDGLKEIFETLNSRIRNPIFGSIAIAFVTINFSALFLLFWGKDDPEIRIQTFSDIGYWRLLFLPISAGLVLSFVTPWVRYFSVWIAEFPVRKRTMLQDESMDKILTQKNHLEAVRNEAMKLLRKEIIDQAKAEDALSDITNPEIRERAVDRLKTIGEGLVSESKKGTEESIVANNLGGEDKLDGTEKALIISLAKASDGIVTEAAGLDAEIELEVRDGDNEVLHYVNFGLGKLGEFKREKFLQNLLSLDLIQRTSLSSDDENPIFEITDSGLQAASVFEKEAP